jgi:hypothetical protein
LESRWCCMRVSVFASVLRCSVSNSHLQPKLLPMFFFCLVYTVDLIISYFPIDWSGLSVTRKVSATARSTIDTTRTIFIWAISLALGWETFKWLQVVGFGVLLYG